MNFIQYIINWFKQHIWTTTTTTTPISNTTTTTTISPNPNTSTTTTPLGGKKVKVGLCSGLNRYPNPVNNLAGCVDDCNDCVSLLNDIYKFDTVVQLLDSSATYKNVTEKMSELLATKPDVFVYTNSSHGTRVADTTGTEDDGYCEAICLYDKFLIDKDFHNILAKADPKTHVIVVSDSCFSAGVTREFLLTMNDFSYVSTPKYLPPEDNIDALNLAMLPLKKAIFEPNENMNEVLLAGCKSDQYSYDASFNVNGTMRPNGAFTYYFIKILRETPNITYADFITKMNQYLPSSRYPQCPVLQTNSQMENVLMFN